MNAMKKRPRPARDSVLLAEALVFLLENTCEALVKAELMHPDAWGVLRDEYLPVLKRLAR